MTLPCEHEQETDLIDASIGGGIVRWRCASGFQHEAGVDEL